uniref:Protein kinase domain-containing protein n=1 Tax=Chromera velia CCMP2878 TaxID=1169474 RepID=A0A0G4F2U8_9ALVE|eukprot:Cvel_14897.t1-p1 / transcript=Cvel_14897.t1 / gene=Cvel_14897 / organism=Chromera_velia_CCMP2878 / gene_product=Calcium-dependent protein kinase 14, putative / transcript_product=Calcium-dependent protein kinase 14, putative / location=Cvel_scaffold1079:11300-15204(+) / protein_length=484 / sequence_SO=supercontig / SO=protein_coding / is_pseudo=false
MSSRVAPMPDYPTAPSGVAPELPIPSTEQVEAAKEMRRSSFTTPVEGQRKTIQKLPADAKFEDFYFMGQTLEICQQAAQSSTRPILKECLEVPDLQPRIVKVIPKSKVPASAGGVDLWRKLCERLLNLEEHTNIMKLLEVFESAESFFLVAEKLEGGELFDFLLTQKAVPEETCKFIMRQIIASVNHLHARGILHRDVKPENLMFRYTPTSAPNSQAAHELALIDFDTCKMLDVPAEEYGEVVNGKRRLVGTYGYLAPEVLRGGEYSASSDMWSVGVILYILMTGIPPLPMENMNSAKESAEVHKSMEKLGIDFDCPPLPSFPKARDLCVRLLQFDPRVRLANAREALAHPWLIPGKSRSSHHSSSAQPAPVQPSQPRFPEWERDGKLNGGPGGHQENTPTTHIPQTPVEGKTPGATPWARDKNFPDDTASKTPSTLKVPGGKTPAGSPSASPSNAQIAMGNFTQSRGDSEPLTPITPAPWRPS